MAYGSSSNAAGTGTATTGTAPASVANGDRLLAIVSKDGGGSSFTPASGWSLLDSDDQSSPDGRTVKLYELKSVSGTVNYDWVTTNSFAWNVQIVRLTGRHATAAATITKTSNTTANNSPVSVSLSGVTAATGDDIVVMLSMDPTSGTETWGFSAITNYTERQEYTGGDWLAVSLQTRDNVSSGATGSLATTATASGAITAGYVGWVIAVPAAASGSTGTSSTTNANDTSNASGTTTVTGTLARTNAADTSSASGTTTVTGTLARTNANDTSSANGTVGSPISGTVAYTNANDTSAASGTTTVTGTSSTINANDTSAASGTTTVTGTLARTNANDTLSASGSAGAVSGTLAKTNANDTSAASGTTTVVGTAGGSSGNIINAASASYADVVAAIASASAGDTVQIPGGASGTATWSSSLTLNKAIHLKGAGSSRIHGHSSSSVAVGTGSKTFTVSNGFEWAAGDDIKVVCPNAASNTMTGTVTSNSAGSLVINVASSTGSGTHDMWVFRKTGQTVITFNAGADFAVTEQAGGHVEVSDFDVLRGTSTAGFWGVSGSLSTKMLIAHDMHFESASSDVFDFVSTVHSLIYKCSFVSAWSSPAGTIRTASCMRYKNTGDDVSWTTASTLGTDSDGLDQHFSEDNFFLWFSTECCDFDDNSRVVWRYNVMHHSGLTSHGQDTSQDGVRHFELYNNRWVYDNNQSASLLPNMDYQFYIRGGSGVIADNVIDDINNGEWGNKTEIRMTIQALRRNAGANACYAGSYPCPRQIGQGHNGTTTTTEGLYIWNNTGGYSLAAEDYSPDECGGGQSVSTFLQLDRDYFTSAKSGYTKFTYPHPLTAEAGTLVNSNDTSAASGTTTVIGTLAKTNANDTSAASGIIGDSANGTLAYTNANDTSAASGTTTIVGTLARTNANDTLAASGTTTVTGTLSATNANDTIVASGTLTIVGTLAKTNANDTVSAQGVADSVTSTLAYTNANDTINAYGVAGQASQASSGGAGHPGGIYWGARKQKKVKSLNKLIDDAIADTLKDLQSKGTPGIKAKTKRIIAKFVEEQKTNAPISEPIKIDYERLARDKKSLDKLLRLHAQMMRDFEDEQILMLLI